MSHSGPRRTVARHGVLRSPSPLGQVLRFVLVSIAVVVFALIGVTAFVAQDLASSFASDAVEIEGQPATPPDIGAIEGGVTLFLAGTDACEASYAAYFGERCTGADSSAELNDVNLLMHISGPPRRVTVVSFPRDLVVPVPECTADDGTRTSEMSGQPLNSVYAVGGLSCVVNTVAALTQQPVDFAAKVTWGGVIEITNAIGGVEVCLANGIRDSNTGIDWPAGNRTIQGIEALQFLRTRYGVGDGSDLGRISNQQQYMSRLARKLVSDEVLSNPATLLRLATTTVKNVTPSQNLTNPVTLAQIALAIKDVPFDQITFVQYPVATDPGDRNRVIPDVDAASILFTAIEENQPFVITGEAGSNEGVIVTEPSPSDDTGSSPEAVSPPATPDPAAGAEQVILPESVTGSTAAQETCSNGNLRQN